MSELMATAVMKMMMMMIERGSNRERARGFNRHFSRRRHHRPLSRRD